MDASTSYSEEEANSTKSIQAGIGNYQAVKDAWGTPNPFIYPEVRRNEEIVETFLGRKVSDPYRWLENPDSEETQTFTEEQNYLAETYLEKASWRDAIRAKLTEMWDFKKTECPRKHGSRYFFIENMGLQNQPILYVKESLDGQPRVLVEPNELSMEGLASISTYSVSPNGEYIAYGLSEYGSDWSSVYIKNVSSGQNYLEVLNFTKLTKLVWTSDNRGFFYPRFPKPKSGRMFGMDWSANLRQKLYYHRIGTRQDDDIMIVELPDNPTWAISTTVTQDGRYLIIFAGDILEEQYAYYMDVGWKGAITRDIPMLSLFNEPGQHTYLANDDTIFYFVTDIDAPNSQIVSFDLYTSNIPEEWTAIVAESPSAVIVWATAVASNKLAVCFNEHLDMRIEIRMLNDGLLLKTIVFTDSISSWDYFGRRDLNEMFVKTESYLNPGVYHKLSFNDDDSVENEVYDKIEIPYYDPEQFSTELVFYSNDDGTNIPMTLIYRNSTLMDTSAPCILYADGGFYKSLLPEFYVPFVLFVQNMDGVVAIANIRGGGEYGKNWWNKGRLTYKENAVEDFIAAAKFLINNRYTRAARLTAMGCSNGATTVTAAVNKHPQLFGAVVADVGIMDLLRFRHFTLGHLWIGEYGDVDAEDELEQLLNVSPLHNITAPTSHSPQYPAIFVSTADHDDRVVPFHSYKYMAELQHTVGQTMNQTNPFMLRVYQNTGHGKGIPSMKAIEKATDVLCFLENSLGYEFHF